MADGVPGFGFGICGTRGEVQALAGRARRRYLARSEPYGTGAIEAFLAKGKEAPAPTAEADVVGCAQG